jgi:glutamate racemase
MTEQKLRGEPIFAQQLTQILAPFIEYPRASQLDTIVLACTHFPLLRQEILAVLPANIDLIDSGAAIARRVEFLLGEHFGMLQNELIVSAPVTHNAVFTQQTHSVEQLRAPLQRFGITEINYIDLEK